MITKNALNTVLMPIEDACFALGIKRTTLYKLIGEKKIRAKKIGKKTLIMKSSIEKFISELPDLRINMSR